VTNQIGEIGWFSQKKTAFIDGWFSQKKTAGMGIPTVPVQKGGKW